MHADKKPRCTWVPVDKPDYVEYHDSEWGVPLHDDQQWFEMLILEGAQAGLSWYTILKRRDGYRTSFKQFNVAKCAKLSDTELEKILTTGNIIRNRLKVYSVRKNALVFQSIQKEFGSFDAYIWRFVGGKPHIRNAKKMLVTSAESDAISRDLKKRGMSFVGSTIIYAFMQATGLINDHSTDCFLAKKAA